MQFEYESVYPFSSRLSTIDLRDMTLKANIAECLAACFLLDDSLHCIKMESWNVTMFETLWMPIEDQ